VPANRVFASAQIPADGRSSSAHREVVPLCVGPWTFHLASIPTEVSQVETISAAAESAAASVELSPSDRQFLIENLLRCPRREYNYPVTIDLNGSVRATRAEGQTFRPN